jgi:hypothetical protein
VFLSIYRNLAQNALQALQTDKIVLKTYGMDESLVKVTVRGNDDLFTGVTITPKNEGALCNTRFDNVKELLERSYAFDVGLRAYGLACINAIGGFLNAKEGLHANDSLRSGVVDFVDKNSSTADEVVIIGHLVPVVEKLRQNGKNVKVFCRQKTDIADALYNDIFEYEALQNADIVVVTAATLLGSTVDAILKFTANAKIVMLTGFSAGGYVPWYKKIGFTHLASLQIKGDARDLRFENLFENPSYLVKL